jgi:hypothetical protein
VGVIPVTSYKKPIFLFVALLVLAVATGLAALPNKIQNSAVPGVQQNAAEGQMPIADYASPEPPTPGERVKRRAKNERYNNQGSPIQESSSIIERMWTTYWWKDIPALPVTQSSIVLIGKVMDARAYLSTDKTGVYSEFSIHAQEILKNDDSAFLAQGELVTVERFGGAVRFASGRIQKYRTKNQGMPHAGRQYLLFLKRISSEQSLSIITAYELRGEHVFPVDGAAGNDERLPFDVYRGIDIASFLAKVRDAVVHSKQNSSDERR